MGDGNQDARELLSALIFSGDLDDKTSSSPKDFLRSIKSRATRFGWNEQQTVSAFTSALKGKAAYWFHSTLMINAGAAEYANIQTNWTEHCLPAFAKQYHVEALSAGIAWNSIMKQSNKESATQYVDRTIDVLHTFFKQELRTIAPDNLPPLADDAVNHINEMNDAGRECIRRRLIEQTNAVQLYYSHFFLSKIAKKLVTAGITDPELRRLTAAEEMTPTCTLNTLCSFINDTEYRLTGQSTNGNNGNGLKKRNNHSNAISDDDEDDEPEVMAVKKTGKNKKKTNKPSKKCTWCLFSGHVEKECRGKASGKPRRTQNATSLTTTSVSAPPTSSSLLCTPNLAPPPSEPSVECLSSGAASGNAAGCW